jgi:hypothetical protein
MSEYSKKERENYNEHRERTSEALGLDKNKYNAFRRLSQKIADADTNAANGKDRLEREYGDKEHKRDTRPNFKKIHEMAKKMGLHMYHQGDPRGAAIHLSKERMSQRDYSSKGRAIY